MQPLSEAIDLIRDASEDVSTADDRTELQSIAVGLQEMIDTAEGKRTDGDAAFAEMDFEGAASHEDNLAELEDNLVKLAQNVDRQDVRERLVAARRRITEYRQRRDD